jgi:dTDP-4-amino-4,6-dideoxygalactose transaminase
VNVPFLDLGAAYRELQPEIDAAVHRVLASGHYILGEELEAFEAEWAGFCGAVHAVGVANGLDALVLALRALDVGPGDEVVVPSNTFFATWLAVAAVGARIVPVEPDPATCNVDAARMAAAITPATRVLLPVHLHGTPVPMDEVVALARERGLRVIEDAAQAHGARWAGQPLGAHGDLVCWSFYPGKNLGALGDAGAVTTADPDLAARLRRLRNYGSSVKYHCEELGVNSRLDPLQAAVLRVKLRHLPAWNERRRAIAATYDTALADLPLVRPTVPGDALPSRHLYVVHTPRRDALQQALAERGVQTLIHYPIPPHRQAAFEGWRWPQAGYPLADQLARSTLSLPMGPQQGQSATEAVVQALRACQAEGILSTD